MKNKKTYTPCIRRKGNGKIQWNRISKKYSDSLIERGKAKNGIAASEIMEVIDSADCSIQQIEKIYETLEENGIEVANDLETVTFDIPDEDLLPDDIDESPEEVEEMLLQEGVTIDDPVRMYLKDIGSSRCSPPKRSWNWPIRCRSATRKRRSSLSRRTCVWSSASPSGTSTAVCFSSI